MGYTRMTGSKPTLIPCKKPYTNPKAYADRWKADTGFLSHVQLRIEAMWDFPTSYCLTTSGSEVKQPVLCSIAHVRACSAVSRIPNTLCD